MVGPQREAATDTALPGGSRRTAGRRAPGRDHAGRARGPSGGDVAVVLVRWPEEADRVEALRAAGVPRLLLVEQEAPPPVSDPLEDWVRVPALEDDVRARVSTLRARAHADVDRPEIDVDGLLHFGGGWVALSPVEQALARELVERFGAVVGRDALARRAWPGGAPTRNALDVHMLRLRRRIAALRLEVRTVRSRGYLLQVRRDGGS